MVTYIPNCQIVSDKKYFHNYLDKYSVEHDSIWYKILLRLPMISLLDITSCLYHRVVSIHQQHNILFLQSPPIENLTFFSCSYCNMWEQARILTESYMYFEASEWCINLEEKMQNDMLQDWKGQEKSISSLQRQGILKFS